MKIHMQAEKLDQLIFKIMHSVSFLAGISLLIVALLCTVDALSSKFFSFSIPSGTDWVTFLNIPVVFLAMGYIQVERGNTVVDLLSSKFPDPIEKIFKITGYVLAVFMCGFLGYCGIGITVDKIRQHTLSSGQASAFPVWPFALLVALGYLLAAIAFLWCIFREFLIPPQRRAGAMMMPGAEEDMGIPKGSLMTNSQTESSPVYQKADHAKKQKGEN